MLDSAGVISAKLVAALTIVHTICSAVFRSKPHVWPGTGGAIAFQPVEPSVYAAGQLYVSLDINSENEGTKCQLPKLGFFNSNINKKLLSIRISIIYW